MKIIFLIISFLSLFWLSYGNEINSNNLTWWNIKCQNLNKKYTINWPEIIKNNINTIYNVKWIKNINWEIIKNKKIILTEKWTNFKHNFIIPWNIILQANFNTWNCNVVINKNIHIYKTIIISILEKENDIVSSLNLDKKNIYLKTIKNDKIEKNKDYVKLADYLIIDQNFVINFFSKNKYKDINFKNKNIILLIWSFKWFFSKLIIPYVKNIYNDNIYIYDSDSYLNIINNIYQWNKLDKKKLLSTSNIWNSFLFPLSYFVNKLISVWLDIKILWIVLSILFWTIIIAFFRQIIWFSVFGVYTPLLFTISIIIFWYKIVLLFFIISIVALLSTHFITQKIYILYSSKISLNYILYTILSIITFWILIKYNLLNLININSSIILLYFIMPWLAKNIIKWENFFSKSSLFMLSEFIIIVWILLLILKITFLKYILIAYPDILWILIIIIILIGRFTWLQLLEYIRFYPLFKKGNFEEE